MATLNLRLRSVICATGFLLVAVFTLVSASAAQQPHPVTIGASYTYVHSNILPGCNCFSMNGGELELGVGLSHHFDAIGEAGATHRGGLTPDGYSLTQITYAFGLRYFPSPRARLRLFGESLFGGAHALGSLAPGNAIGGSSNAIAFLTGGGAALRLNRSFELQPARIDYELTTFDNGQANRQNDIRLSAGVLYRFGARNK